MPDLSTWTIPRDYYNSFEFNVAAGMIPGAEVVHKFGHDEDLDESNLKTVWDVNTSVPVSYSSVLSLVSSSTADNGVSSPAGTGARTVLIYGLDANYDAITETVTLNGTTPVTTTKVFTGINRMVVTSAGTGRKNAGAITVTDSSSPAQTVGYIIAEHSITQQGFYYVPRYHKLMADWLTVNARKATGGADVLVEFRGFVRDYTTGVDREVFQHQVDTATELTSPPYAPPVHFVIEGPALFEMQVKTSAANTVAITRFAGILLKSSDG